MEEKKYPQFGPRFWGWSEAFFNYRMHSIAIDMREANGQARTVCEQCFSLDSNGYPFQITLHNKTYHLCVECFLGDGSGWGLNDKGERVADDPLEIRRMLFSFYNRFRYGGFKAYEEYMTRLSVSKVSDALEGDKPGKETQP